MGRTAWMGRYLGGLLGAGLALGGCYASHSVDAGDARLPLDVAADVRPRVDVPADARDAPIDPTCIPHPVAAVCLDFDDTRGPFVSVHLESLDGECLCAERLRCDVGAAVGASMVDLTVGSCGSAPCDCAELASIECELPPGLEGLALRANGVELLARVPDAGAAEIRLCYSSPEAPTCGALDPAHSVVERACVSHRGVVGESLPITLIDTCGTCGASPGTCAVAHIAGASFLDVDVQEVPPACPVACPGGCQEIEYTCWLPPLPDGVYAVLPREGGFPVPIEILDGRSPAIGCADF